MRISALTCPEGAEALTTATGVTHAVSVILASLPYIRPWAVDFTPLGVNKGSGVARMGKMLGVEPTDMACVGDSYNDLPMFAACGLAIAMGGAPDDIKSAATLTAPTVEEDGLAHAIDRHILPRVN